MKIGLINPKGTIFSKNEKLHALLQRSVSMDSFRHFWSAPCLGLLTIAAYIPAEWEVEYIDENYRQIDFHENFDIVCISAMTVQAVRAYEISSAFRKRGVLTVIGGIHATILPEEALRYADVVIAGEGEPLFPQFINDYRKGNYKALYKQAVAGTFPLENSRMPRYDLIDSYQYPVINLCTTRGCPRSCSFCCASNVFGLKYRRKTNLQIFNELTEIQSHFPDRLILFADDNVFILRNQSIKLLDMLSAQSMRWIAQTDISIADDADLLKKMYQSGCQWIVIGFESVSENSLKTLEKTSFKYKYIKKYQEKIKRIQDHGIKVYGTFIVGLEEDDVSIFEKTANFILNNRLYGANITVPTPLPGTSLRTNMLRQGRVICNDWAYYTLWDVVFSPKQMSAATLEDGLFHVYRTLASQENTNDRLKGFLHELRKQKHERM